MEQAWTSALLAGMFSSLVVGVIMALFNKHMTQTQKASDENLKLKFSNLDSKVAAVSSELKILEGKVEAIAGTVNKVDKRTALIAGDQGHLVSDIKDMKEEFKVILASGNFGKVIRKP